MQRTTPLGVLMIVSAILLPTLALVCLALGDRCECGGDETATPAEVNGAG